MTDFNPFSRVLGPKLAPHAPTLNASYMDNLRKTFSVLNGDLPADMNQHPLIFIAKTLVSPKLRLGIIDYLPFGLLDVGLNHFKDWMIGGTLGVYEKLPLWAKVPSLLWVVPFVALGAVTLLAQIALRTITTVVAAVITAVAALVILPLLTGIASLIKNSMLKIAGLLTGTPEPSEYPGYRSTDNRACTLESDIFNHHNPATGNINGAENTYVTVRDTRDPDYVTLKEDSLSYSEAPVANPFHKDERGTTYQMTVKMKHFTAHAFRSDTFNLDEVRNTANDTPALAPIRALIKLNYGGMTEELEKREEQRVQSLGR